MKKFKQSETAIVQSNGGSSKEKRFITQCRPQSMFELIKNLNAKQQQAVCSIGFEGLLKLSTPTVPIDLIREFVMKFNGVNRMLTLNDKHSFVITSEDIQDVFLLPGAVGNDVILSKRNEYAAMNTYKKLGENFHIDNDTSLTKVKSILLDLKEGCDDFKRLFVLFSLSSFLCPSANRAINFKTIKTVVDVSKIGEFDWCSYVLKCLCKAVSKFNSVGLVKNCSGCVFVLPILYFHRMKWQSNAEPSSLPLIQHWTDVKLRKRFKEEKLGGGYGNGVWINDLYPISKVKCQEELFECETKDSDEECDELSRFIKFKMPENQPCNAEIKKMAKDGVHKSILLMKRDISIVMNTHMERMLKEKRKMAEMQEPLKDSPSPEISEIDRFFSDANVHKCIDELIENWKMQNMASFEGPSFDLHITPEENQEIIDDGDDANDADDDACPEEIDREIIALSSHKKGKIGGECLKWELNDVGYAASFMTYNKRWLEAMSTHEKEVIDYCLFKDDAFDTCETLFKYNNTQTLSREMIQSFDTFEMLFSPVIDVWCLLLNKQEISKPIRSKRFYFNSLYSVYLDKVIKSVDVEMNEQKILQCWNNVELLDKVDITLVNMILIPVILQKHFFGVVVNIRDKKIQYLDNRKFNNPDYFEEAISLIQTLMGTFLQQKYHPNAVEVIHYMVENVAFSWQTKTETIDCGVFLMHHLENFDGIAYSSPNLGKAYVRRFLRGQYCAQIVMSEHNKNRNTVMKKVCQFNRNKPQILIKIAEMKAAKKAGKKRKR